MVLRTLRFTEFAGIPSLEVFQTCLGPHCVAGVLDEDWGKHAWDNLLSFCSRLRLGFVLPGVTGDFSSLVWSRMGHEKNEQVASLWFVLTHLQGIAPLSEEHALQFTPHSPRFFYTSVGSTFGFSVSERCSFGNWSEGSNMPKRYDSSFCGEQLTRRGELLGLLQAGWSPPTVNCTWFAPCSLWRSWYTTYSYRKANFIWQLFAAPRCWRFSVTRCVSACLLQHLQVCYASIAPNLGTANCMWQKSEHSKIGKCGFLLPPSSVSFSDLDRLIGEGVTLCGHACFNTTCSLESVLKGGADCGTASRHG